MDLSNLDPQDANFVSQSGFTEATRADYQPGLWDNAGGALISGIESGASIASQSGIKGVIASNMQQFTLLHPEASEAIQKPVNQAIDTSFTNFRKSIAPDAETTGKAGQILFGLGQYAPALAGAVVHPVLGAGVAQQISQTSTTEELLSKGVSQQDAEDIALPKSLVDAAGFLLPAAVGGNLVMRLTSGAGINMAAGAASREVTNLMLMDKNYSAVAEQYKAWDGEALIVDGILGAAFGGIHHLTSRGADAGRDSGGPEQTANESVRQSDIDAALAMNEAHNHDIATSPVLHGTPESMDAHYRAMGDAAESIARGETVDVSAHTDSFDGHLRPESFSESARPEMESALHENGINTSEPPRGRQPQTSPEEGESQFAQFLGDEGSVDPDTGVNLGNSYELATASRLSEEMPDLTVEHPDTGQQVKLSDLIDEYNDKIATSQDSANVFPFVASCMLRNPE
ncbi:hypothetical protein ACNF2L_16440 [Klebsiella pneumoniae]|uniref:hypothetical protein n=1 Tax=Klebsiella pneumoniae TaxID=573 RepID=UPI003CEA4631